MGGEIEAARCVLTCMRPLSELPILATIPRSGTWFLRYTISFLCHLDRGGRIDDRLTGEIVGPRWGPAFDFQGFKGGPLFAVGGILPMEHLFIGHTVCPGFAPAEVDWWDRSLFHVPGYDYFHEGWDYRYTSVELASYRHAPVSVAALDRAAAKGRGPRIVLVYRNPLDQAISYYRYCQGHGDGTYHRFKGRPLVDVGFAEYLFEGALLSYAKQFVSFQLMAIRYPHLVRLIAFEHLVANPVEAISSILDHLSGVPQRRPALPAAVRLTRQEHMQAIERTLGRSLDGSRGADRSHMRTPETRPLDSAIVAGVRDRALATLRRLGIDTALLHNARPQGTAAAAQGMAPRHRQIGAQAARR